LSEENAYSVKQSTDDRAAASMTRRAAFAPARCPAIRGKRKLNGWAASCARERAPCVADRERTRQLENQALARLQSELADLALAA